MHFEYSFSFVETRCAHFFLRFGGLRSLGLVRRPLQDAEAAAFITYTQQLSKAARERRTSERTGRGAEGACRG